MQYGYARVSASDQNLGRQIEEFLKFGIEKNKIFCDKKSGKNFDRKEYTRLIRRLRAGDLLVVKSIDRLGRNYDMIIAEWKKITSKIGADILVLDMPLLDTRDKADNLIGKFISDIVLQLLSFVAENERINIRTRQAEGIALAKQRGICFGRPKKKYTDMFVEVTELYSEKKIVLSDALDLLNVKQSTFYYHLHKLHKDFK
ncbi:MAG: recombinase family protein [Clostridia bacterium]|nr:recombinase family protein [Clostridia bacterium]